MNDAIEFLHNFWKLYYKKHPIPVRQAHRRFFVDKEPGGVRIPKFPYHRDVVFWHYAGDLRSEIVRWLTRMENRGAR